MRDKFKSLLGISWHEGLIPSLQEVGNEAVTISPVQWVFLRHALIIAEKATHEPNAPSHQMSAHFLAGLAKGLLDSRGNSEEKNQYSSEYNQKHEQKNDVHRSESSTSANETQETPIKSHDKHPAEGVMSDTDNNGQDDLTLCEAVASQFKMSETDAKARIYAGYVSINGEIESNPDTVIQNDDNITVRPDPSGDEWDAFRSALNALLASALMVDLIGWRNELAFDLNVVIKTAVSAEVERRRDA